MAAVEKGISLANVIMPSILSILYVIGLFGAYLAGSLHLRARSAGTQSTQNQILRKVPYTTFLMVFLIAIPSSLQFFFPVMLRAFERDYARFLAGDWWRLITSLFVQDGGIAGSMFNLVSLLMVGFMAEQLWDAPSWLLIFFAGGILSQFVGFLWQPVGAGNSVANFSLAASIAVLCFRFYPSQTPKVTAILALGAGVILLFLKDIHGAAMLIGAAIALLLIRWSRRGLREQP